MNGTRILLIGVGVVLAAGLAVWASVALANCGSCGGGAVGEGQAEKTAIVNTHCPIMGTKLDPANVPESLARVYKGQKVGFCCAGCLPAWDKLSDQEKDTKLAEAVRKD